MKTLSLNSHFMLLSALAMSLGLSGCEKSPTGQVAAVVNGEEVTLQEINSILDQANVSDDADKKLIRQQALRQLIDQRLLAQQAKEEGLDQSPEYLIKSRQLAEALLVRMYAEKVGSTIRVPDEKAIQNYITGHPYSFANRTVYALDQIKFPSSGTEKSIKALEASKTMDEVVATLQQLGIKFARGQATMDSAQLDPRIMAQIAALPAGEPFIVPTGPVMTVSVIKAKQPAPLAAEQSSPAAVKAIRDEQMGETLEERLKESKAKAKIEYQEGFSPPKEPAKPPLEDSTKKS